MKEEIKEADRAHANNLLALEKSLLEERIAQQKTADATIASMQEAAQAKANKFLEDHTTALAIENKLIFLISLCNQLKRLNFQKRSLEKELKQTVLTTQSLLEVKARLEKENVALRREQTVREDLVRIRVGAVHDAQVAGRVEEETRRRRAVRGQNEVLRQALEKTGLPDVDGLGTRAEGKGEGVVGLPKYAQKGIRPSKTGKSGGGGVFNEQNILKVQVVVGSGSDKVLGSKTNSTGNAVDEIGRKEKLIDLGLDFGVEDDEYS